MAFFLQETVGYSKLGETSPGSGTLIIHAKSIRTSCNISRERISGTLFCFAEEKVVFDEPHYATTFQQSGCYDDIRRESLMRANNNSNKNVKRIAPKKY
jgi:hypothetical protein